MDAQAHSPSQASQVQSPIELSHAPGFLNKLRATLSTALRCVRPQTPTGRQQRLGAAVDTGSKDSSMHVKELADADNLRVSAPAAVAVSVPKFPLQQATFEKTSAPQFSAQHQSHSPQKPALSQPVSNFVSRPRQQAVFPLDPAGRRPVATGSLQSLQNVAAHPMWPPLVPSPPGSSMTNSSQQQSSTVKTQSAQLVGGFMPLTPSSPVAPAARGAVSDESLQVARYPLSPQPDALLRSVSSVAVATVEVDALSLRANSGTGTGRSSKQAVGSSPLSGGEGTLKPLTRQCSSGMSLLSGSDPSIAQMQRQQQHRKSADATTPSAGHSPAQVLLPLPKAHLSPVRSVRSDRATADGSIAGPLPPVGSPVRVPTTAGLMVTRAASSNGSTGYHDMVTRNSPPLQRVVLMAAAAQRSHQQSPVAGPAAGPASAPVVAPETAASIVHTQWPMRSASDAGHAPVTASNLAAQAPSAMDHCLVTAWDDEGNGSGLSLASCPNYWGIPRTSTDGEEPLAQGSHWAEFATWPGSLGLYSDQEVSAVRIAVASKQPVKLLQTQASADAAKLKVELQAVEQPIHGATEPPVSKSVHVPKDGAVKQVHVRHIPASDSLSRLANGTTVRRTLRVSSTELQEAVKASLVGHGKQQVQPSVPARSNNLDMELSTLNISRLDAELLGLVLIGRGGGGLVFRAVWQGAQVAVKFMIGKTPASVSMGALEAVLAASVNHPNVVQTYGFDVTRVRESSFRHSTNKVDANELGSSAIASILRELEREKIRVLSHATVDDRLSHGSSASQGGSPVNSAELKRFALAQANTQAAANGNIMASFNSEEGFGEPTELVPANGWSLAQVLHALDTQPGMFMTHIIMEFCDRGTLLSALQRGVFKVGGTSGDASRFNDRVVLRAALRTARDVARGMQHLHASGIIHGDLKPGNVLLKGSRSDRRGFTAKVADFGLSKVVLGNALLEMHHWSTVTHMAPEVIQGTWCKQSDVYSFGVLLWQLMCGEPLPFKDLTIQQLVLGVSQGRLRLQWPHHCHPAVAKLGEACVAFEASVRPSFQEIGDVLVQIEQNVRNELRWVQQVPSLGQLPRH